MESAAEILEKVRVKAVVCTDCDLSLTRRNVVFGEGSAEADLLFIGEGPGEVEDETGRPFVGRAGALLDEVLQENGIRRGDVYIANVIKCRAFTRAGGRTKNRPPRVGEVKACRKWLQAQLDTIKPKVIVCVGGPAAKLIINKDFKMTQERGIWFQTTGYAPFCMAVLHPAYVLRQEGESFEKSRALLSADIAEIKDKLRELGGK